METLKRYLIFQIYRELHPQCYETVKIWKAL